MKDLKVRFLFDNTRSLLFFEIENKGAIKAGEKFIINLSGNEIGTDNIIELDQIKHGYTRFYCEQMPIVEIATENNIKLQLIEASDKSYTVGEGVLVCNLAIQGDLILYSERSFVSVRQRKFFKFLGRLWRILLVLLISSIILKFLNIFSVNNLYLIVILLVGCFGIYGEGIYRDKLQKAKKIRY